MLTKSLDFHNSSALAFGFIPWKDIDDIFIASVMGNQFIELVLNNEDLAMLFNRNL